jgi:hypothetical protein
MRAVTEGFMALKRGENGVLTRQKLRDLFIPAAIKQ